VLPLETVSEKGKVPATETKSVAVRADPVVDLGRALELLERARSPGTLRAYRIAWEDWQRYRVEAGKPEDLPMSVADLLAWLGHCQRRGLAVSTIEGRVAAVKAVHDKLDLPSPTTHPQARQFLRGLRRDAADRGERPVQKRALTASMLAQMLGALEGRADLVLRDRAILLVGYATGLRRSELAGLFWSDLTFEEGAAVVRVRRSKTDQIGAGRSVGIAENLESTWLCPVLALRAWADFRPRTDTRIFACSGKTIARVVKRACASVGFPAADFGAHSMRRGMVTEAKRAGVPDRDIMEQTGHTSPKQITTYTEPTRAAQNAATRAVVAGLRHPEDQEGEGT